MPTESQRLEVLAGELALWSRTRDLTGAMLLTRGGAPILAAYLGYADRASRTPVTEATRFGIASVTKMFTATTMVSLVRDGAAALETAVVDVLPSERRPSTLRPEVTVHHLLCHTSGIADYGEEDEESPAYVADYAALWSERPSYTFTHPVDFLPLFGDLTPYRQPGQLACRRAASSGSTNRFQTWRSATVATHPKTRDAATSTRSPSSAAVTVEPCARRATSTIFSWRTPTAPCSDRWSVSS